MARSANRRLSLPYTKPQPIDLKTHVELDERWVQEKISEDPSILGLGDLTLRDKERMQPRAGRLDLLLEDPDSGRRYEVEVQLGRTDPSHIIRTVEYWDIERKRYPDYDHCAVLVAEDVTSRFQNVISLFNRAIPFVAIQMRAFEVEGKVALLFTTIVDERHLGPDAEKEEPSPSVDRRWWDSRRPPNVMAIVDGLTKVLNDIDPGWSLDYNKGNVHIVKVGKTGSFMRMRPRKRDVLLILRVDETRAFTDLVDRSDLDSLPYLHAYRIVVREEDLTENRQAVSKLIETALQVTS